MSRASAELKHVLAAFFTADGPGSSGLTASMPGDIVDLQFRMNAYLRLASQQKGQYVVYGSLAAALVACAALGHSSNRSSYQRFLGDVNPVGVLSALLLIGAVCLSLLAVHRGFSIFRFQRSRRFLLSSGIAGALGLIMVAVDSKVVFARDLNAPFPGSLTFYPVIGFVVEVLFHLVPLTLLLLLVPLVLRAVDHHAISWMCIAGVSLLEPAYQVRMMASGENPLWLLVYLGLHLTAFNVLQLWLFKRYDFMTMYSFRLGYYLIWHVGWGYLRLQLLF